jgi:hypothetical protein
MVRQRSGAGNRAGWNEVSFRGLHIVKFPSCAVKRTLKRFAPDSKVHHEEEAHSNSLDWEKGISGRLCGADPLLVSFECLGHKLVRNYADETRFTPGRSHACGHERLRPFVFRQDFRVCATH